MRTRKVFYSLGLLLIVAFVVVCIYGAVQANQNAIAQRVEVFSTGDTVELGPNYFVDAGEDPTGYAIRVNGAELVEYEPFLESMGGTAVGFGFSEGYPPPKYTCLLHVTIRNTDNESGAIMALNYALYNGALKIPVDYSLWGLMDPNLTGTPGFRLQKDTEVDITIPFTPMPSSTGVNNKEVSRRMESERLFFCISEFPVRKMVEIKSEIE